MLFLLEIKITKNNRGNIMKKFLQIEVETREGIEKFYEDIFVAENLEEIKTHINKLLELTYRYASKNNNRPNKGLKVFQEYRKLKDTRETKVKKEIHKKAKKHYKDYLEHFFILRRRKYSYAKISNYAKEELNIKVSRETLRKELSKLEEYMEVRENV
jgi:DNA repair ATPase RecN